MDQNQNHDLFKKPDFIEELSEAAKKMINNPRNRKLNARDYISKHERKLEADKAKYIRVMAFGGYSFEKSLYIEDSENPIKSFLYSVHEVDRDLRGVKLSVKLFYSAVIGFTRYNNYNKHIVEYVHLALDPIVIMQESDIKVIKTMGPDFDNAIDNARMRGSGFKVVDIQE